MAAGMKGQGCAGLGQGGGSDGKGNLSTMQETQVRPLGWEAALEKAVAAHSSVLAWEIPWTEEPAGLQSTGSQSQKRLSD